MLVDVKIPPRVWQALSLTLKHIEKQVRHFYIQNCQTDDLHFPDVISALLDRPELLCVTLIKLTLGPKFVRDFQKLLYKHEKIKEVRIVDCQFEGTTVQDFLESLNTRT